LTESSVSACVLHNLYLQSKKINPAHPAA